MTDATTGSRLGTKLKALREKRHLTQPEVAEGSGVGFRTLCDFEKGIRLPSGRNLEKLAVFFKTSAAALLK